jgi:integrase
MIGVQRDKKGPFIQFKDPSGIRRKIRLTGMSERDQGRFADRVNDLRTAKQFGMALDDSLIKWAISLNADMAGKLADYGLLPRREAKHATTLKAHIEDYINRREDVKPRTKIFFGQTRDSLIRHFGADRDLATITPGDADEFRLALLSNGKIQRRKREAGEVGLSEATARRRCRLAYQFFRAAKRKHLITENPFEGVGGAAKSNKERMYFVTREEAAKVLDACPDAEARLIFALSRFGGLRTPSEHFALRLDEINWEQNKFLVRSPKTERHPGGESRWVPIFPELARGLLEAGESADAGDVYVIRRYRNHTNLGTMFGRIIKQAGVKRWPKIFQNCRSTRQTELSAEYPLHLVCAWLGNKAAVAQEHYLQVTDADFQRAATPPVGQGGARVAHSGSNQRVPGRSSTGENLENSEDCDGENTEEHSGKLLSVGPVCVEHTVRRTEKTSKMRIGGASVGASAPTSPTKTPAGELERVVAAWPDLSAGARRAILDLIDREGGDRG